jgi:hypothetical protein
MKTGANLGVKKRKPFVSPSLLKGPFHVTTGFKVRMFATHSTLSVKRSGYFSHSSPQPWELTSPDTPTGQEVSNGDVQKNGVDGFGDCDLDILKELQPPAVANIGLAEQLIFEIYFLSDLFAIAFNINDCEAWESQCSLGW